MYLSHFGLKELPFGLTPDTEFIYSAQSHLEALNTLIVATESGEGFVKITGEVGTGKTLLCRRFLATLDDRYVTAYIPNPQLEPRAFLRSVFEELGAAESEMEGDFVYLTRRINKKLLELADQGKRVLLCLDEAQTMPALTLESMRLLSNLETEKRKLIQIALFGQPELDAKLGTTTLRQLLQRIAFHYRIQGLSRDELSEYLDHRLRVAGYHGAPMFSSAARRGMFFYSGGIPRLVNILAHKAMLAAFGQGRERIRFSHVRRAAKDTESAYALPWWRPVL